MAQSSLDRNPQMKPIEFDGMTYGQTELMGLREELIKLRDAALDQGDFEAAVQLSVTVAILYHVAEGR